MGMTPLAGSTMMAPPARPLLIGAEPVREGQAKHRMIRASDIERAVKSVTRGGAQVFRVVIEVHEGRIIIDTAPTGQDAQTFDSLDFRREAI